MDFVSEAAILKIMVGAISESMREVQLGNALMPVLFG